MPLILIALLVFVLLAFCGLVLLSLALRYRAGTARRQGRRWVATVNVWVTSFSAVFFIGFTFVLSFWLGPTLPFALAGMGVGSVLGIVGLAATRWESAPEGLFYTPSRWLALLIAVAITARLAYGWWRATHPAGRGEPHLLLSASASQLSVAVAAGLIGYYLIFAIGVCIRVKRHHRWRAS